MVKYYLSNLNILETITKDNVVTRLICTKDWSHTRECIVFKEIFTGEKIYVENIKNISFEIKKFKDYFPELNELDTPKTKKEILEYCKELEKIELLKNIDDNDIENYLTSKNKFRGSKVYKKRYSK